MSSFGVGANLGHAAVSVATTATEIRPSLSGRKSVYIQVTGANNVYIGKDNTVTLANGLQLRPNESVKLEDYNGPIWGIAQTGATDVRFLEVS